MTDQTNQTTEADQADQAERAYPTRTVVHPTKGDVTVPGDAWITPGDADVAYARIETDDETWHLIRNVSDGDTGHILLYDQNEWDAFVAGAREGEFDLETLADPSTAVTHD